MYMKHGEPVADTLKRILEPLNGNVRTRVLVMNDNDGALGVDEGEEKFVLLTTKGCPHCSEAKKQVEESVEDVDVSSSAGRQISETLGITEFPELVGLKKQGGRLFACVDTENPENMRCKEVESEEDIIAKIQIRNTMTTWKKQREREIKDMEGKGVSPKWIQRYQKVVLEVDKALEKMNNGDG